MLDGGITYADKQVLIEQMPSSVEEIHGAKFITGGNLGLNLRNPERAVSYTHLGRSHHPWCFGGDP